MKKCNAGIIIIVMAGLLAVSTEPSSATATQVTRGIKILSPAQHQIVDDSILPAWEEVQLGQPLMLQAMVTGYSPNQATNLTFQWEWNKAPYATNSWAPNQTLMQLKLAETNWTSLPGSMNSSIFSVASASPDTVAFYRVKVFAPGGQTNVSDFAPVWVWLKGVPPSSVWNDKGRPEYLYAKHHSVCVLGTVVNQTGGPPPGCPGTFQYRVDYPGHLPIPNSAPYYAYDVQQGSTWIAWSDQHGCSDPGGCCSQTSESGSGITVAVVHPSDYHYFTIFVGLPPSSSVPVTPYFIYLPEFQ